MSYQVPAWLEELCRSLPEDAVLETQWFRGQCSIIVDPGKLLKVMRSLRDDRGFRYLTDVTALDLFPQEPRFQVVYHLWSHRDRRLLRVKTPVSGQSPALTSVTGLWSTANWHEREVYDLFGIEFIEHPDLRRILTPEGWQGHPLRKDYPVEGPPEVQNWVPPRIDSEAG